MRKHLLASALALGLAGCVGTGAATPPPPISVLPEQLQSAIQATCGVVLTANSLSTVISIFGGGGLANLSGAAAQVCSALTGTGAPRGVAGSVVTGTLRGHRITGHRVR